MKLFIIAVILVIVIAIAMIPVVRALYSGTLTPDIVAW